MEAIRIEHIEKRFNDFIAVNDVSFMAEKGAFLTLLGPSGCGKTTILKLIGGFYKPDTGRIFIDGKNVTAHPPEMRDTTMCFQSYALFPHLSVTENIVFGLKQHKVPADERSTRLESVSTQVHLENQIDKYPSMLSGGQQQRVALARALAMRSGVILFDEPLSNLDAKLRERVRIEIRSLQEEYGFTAIYVTHDQSEALAMSDWIIVLKDGQIEQQGTPKSIYNNPVNSFIADFIGTANILDAEIRSSQGNGTYSVSSAMGDFTVQSDTAPPAKRCRISWRPEDAIIPADTCNIFESQIVNTAYQGNTTEIFISPAANNNHQGFRIQAPGDFSYRSGERIRFSIDRNKFTFLEALE